MRLLLAVLLGLALPLAADSSEGPTVQIDFSNPAISPSAWTLVLHPDGSGHFKSAPGTPSKEAIDVPRIDRPIQLTPSFAQYVLSVASSHTVLSDKCESHMNVAFQGWKTITYQNGAMKGSCRFNYSKDKQIEELSNALLAVATTLVEGQRLEILLLHDPLGLDREMGFLVDGTRDGRIRQLGSIQEILNRLADDQTVMERVQKRARILLATAAAGK